MLIAEILPIQIFGFDCGVIDEIVEAVKDEPYKEHEAMKQYTEQTENSFLHKTHPVLGDYLQRCNDELWDYLKECPGCNDNRLVTTQCWMNKATHGAVKKRHKHPNSIVSGILYLTDNEAPTIFENINLYKFGFILVKKEHYDYHPNDTTRGHTVMFPSKLAHFVLDNTEQTDRITISWNTFLDGDISNVDTLTHLNVKVL